MRTLNANEIKTIANDKCNAFVDALATCATADCLHHLTGLVNSKQISDKVYQSFALLPNPSKEMIEKVANAVAQTPATGKAPQQFQNFFCCY